MYNFFVQASLYCRILLLPYRLSYPYSSMSTIKLYELFFKGIVSTTNSFSKKTIDVFKAIDAVSPFFLPGLH
jgi:hypothetical protein